jgi:U3 small nucleolar RNA-associated protein 13
MFMKLVGSNEKRVVTGGADSTLVVWKDTTEEKQEEARVTSQERILGEQRLANFMHSRDFDSALELALILNRPHSALKSIEGT